MKKNDKFISLVIFALVIAVDLFSKSLFLQGKINFIHDGSLYASRINYGFIFGTLKELPKELTLVTLSSFGGVIFSAYLFLITLLSRRLLKLKIGLGFFAGGVVANVFDRAMHGGTFDFIPFSLLDNLTFYFNPADMFQWVGFIFIIIDLFSKEKLIWHPGDQRKLSLINRHEQIKFSLKLVAISFCTCVVLGTFSISYLTLTIQSTAAYSRSTVFGFSFCFLMITLLLMFMAFLAGMVLSKRSVGPLYAFEKYVESLLDGDVQDLKLREGDNYKHLEEVALRLKVQLSSQQNKKNELN